jgi:hypothetical protein
LSKRAKIAITREKGNSTIDAALGNQCIAETAFAAFGQDFRSQDGPISTHSRFWKKQPYL